MNARARNTERQGEFKPRKPRAPAASTRGLNTLAPEGLYRVDQFIPSIIGVGKTYWYDGVAHGRFPAPAVRGGRMALWRGSDIIAAVSKLASGG